MTFILSFMRNILFCFIAMTIFTMCDPCLGNKYRKGEWYIKNLTEQKLGIDYYNSTYTIFPLDSIQIAYFYLEGCYNSKAKVNFDAQFKNYLSTSIYSEDNTLLTRWLYSEKDLPNRQFFNETYWHYYNLPVNKNEPMMDVWTFEILPEDIVSE